jgi:two-component system cell cycle response regulator
MALTDGTTQRIALTGIGMEALRWRSRQIAHRIAADCERLLDELLQSKHSALREGLSNGLIAARTLASMMVYVEGAPPLFDMTLRPSARVEEAHRRLCDALAFAAPAIPVSPGEDLAIATLAEMHQSAMTMFSGRPAAGPAPDDSKSERARVLIVDDEPLMISLLQRAVGSMGHDTITASNGAEALEKLGKNEVDLVLTDIEMPNMSGVELLTAIKSRESMRHIPVVVISGADDMAHVTQCIAAGAEDHIAKPFQQELLRARVTASIDRKRFADRDTAQRIAVAKLIEAAEAVELGRYSTDRISTVADRSDGVGKLARVFDRMVMGLKLREDRLRERVAASAA